MPVKVAQRWVGTGGLLRLGGFQPSPENTKAQHAGAHAHTCACIHMLVRANIYTNQSLEIKKLRLCILIIGI